MESLYEGLGIDKKYLSFLTSNPSLLWGLSKIQKSNGRKGKTNINTKVMHASPLQNARGTNP
jgi:hypothetical protein